MYQIYIFDIERSSLLVIQLDILKRENCSKIMPK